MTRTALAVLVSLGVASERASTASVEGPPAAIAVRVYASWGISADDLKTAARQAQTSFNDIGLEVVWTYCVGTKRSVACEHPVWADELVVRLVASGSSSVAGEMGMGYALVVPSARHSTVATIYLDLVRSMAKRGAVDVCRLLGRVIAHEIGHLLLNTNQHANSGLMRAVWMQPEMRHENPRDWRFSDRDAATIKASLTPSTVLHR